jgi:ABC-2 type transport system permease protein
MRPYLGQLTAELRLAARNGEQLLVSMVIPLLVLVFFSLVDVVAVPDGYDARVDFIAPGVLALAVMSTAMVSLGIGTGFERQYGVLKRLGATPLGRGRWLAAKVTTVLVTIAVQMAVLIPTAVVLGWRPDGPLVALVPALLAGTAAFAGLGLLLAGTLRGTVTLGVANGLYVILLLAGGMVFPLEQLPDAVETVARLLPAAALTGAVTSSVESGAGDPGAWVVLGVWAVAMPVLATWRFRWE